jgi:RNA polymerase sigma factor (sigma-70 family)
MTQKLFTQCRNGEPGASKTLHEAEALPKRLSELLGTVQSGDPAGLSKFHNVFGRGLRFILFREVACDKIEEEVLDVLRSVIAEMKRGSSPEPQDLPHFVIMMARRRSSRHSSNPQREEKETGIQRAVALAELNVDMEKQQMIQQQAGLAEQALASLNRQQQEILNRRYLRGQTNKQICAAMNLTETEVRSCETRFRNSVSTFHRKERLDVSVASAATI